MNPYRSESVRILYIDFSVYYEDALAIGFSSRKAANYAFKCCMEEKERIRSLISSGECDIYNNPWKVGQW